MQSTWHPVWHVTWQLAWQPASHGVSQVVSHSTMQAPSHPPASHDASQTVTQEVWQLVSQLPQPPPTQSKSSPSAPVWYSEKSRPPSFCVNVSPLPGRRLTQRKARLALRSTTMNTDDSPLPSRCGRWVRTALTTAETIPRIAPIAVEHLCHKLAVGLAGGLAPDLGVVRRGHDRDDDVNPALEALRASNIKGGPVRHRVLTGARRQWYKKPRNVRHANAVAISHPMKTPSAWDILQETRPVSRSDRFPVRDTPGWDIGECLAVASARFRLYYAESAPATLIEALAGKLDVLAEFLDHRTDFRFPEVIHAVLFPSALFEQRRQEKPKEWRTRSACDRVSRAVRTVDNRPLADTVGALLHEAAHLYNFAVLKSHGLPAVQGDFAGECFCQFYQEGARVRLSHASLPQDPPPCLNDLLDAPVGDAWRQGVIAWLRVLEEKLGGQFLSALWRRGLLERQDGAGQTLRRALTTTAQEHGLSITDVNHLRCSQTAP